MKKFLTAILFSFLFFSCEKKEISLEDLYASLPDIEYFSQNYSINEQALVERMIFNPVSPRIGAGMPLNLKYKEQDLAVIYHIATNNLLVMLAANTQIGDICSVYESQGLNNQRIFINGKSVDIEPGYALIDWKINHNDFIFFLVHASGKTYYMAYTP